MRWLVSFTFLAVLLGPGRLLADDAVYRLPIGDPQRKGRELPVSVDTIRDAASGAMLTPDELPARLQKTRLLLLGESHTSVESHRMQLQVLRELRRAGRPVLIGLEMYPYTAQASLDAWHEGTWSEQEFLDRSRWYEHWGYHWNYYRDIFRFARVAGIRMCAVNAPRDVVTAVRRKGFTNLTPEEAAHVPTRIAPETPDYVTLFKTQLNDGGTPHPGMTDEAVKGMLAAQATWDGTMAWNAVKTLEAADPEAIMVVLVGAGHVGYGLGIERQARQYFDGQVDSIIAVPVADDEGRPIAAVRASYASYVWGVAAERDSAYPSLGVATIASPKGRAIIDVRKDSSGSRAGLQAGDIINALDGHAVDGQEAYNRLMAGKEWGDTVRVGLIRGSASQTIEVALRRRPPIVTTKGP